MPRLTASGVLCAAALFLALAPAAPTSAQESETIPPTVFSHPRLAPDVARSQAEAVFAKYCASCHQSENPQAMKDTAFANILRLDDIVRDETLIVPGQPDASRLYHVLLSKHMPRPIFQSSSGYAGPTVDEIDAVRDWIEGLSTPAPGCPDRPTFAARDTLALMQDWRRQMGTGAEDLRFVALGYLSNACLSERDLEIARNGVASAIASLAGRPAITGVEAIGDWGALLSFRLSEAGLTSQSWSVITMQAPRTMAGAVPAEWLAARAGNVESAVLARNYRQDVGLRKAAVELGVSEVELIKRLIRIEGPDGKLAKQLRQGLVSRTDWEHLYRVIRKLPPGNVVTGSVSASTDLRLRLWSDKAVYKSGDLASITALASSDCYLTLIGIDRKGAATILFPNEFEPENFLRGGTSITIPVRSATYQLRVKEAGTERVVGICSAERKRLTGVLPDYERQRFTVLGNWRVFLATADQLETDMGKSQQSRGRNRDNSGLAKSAVAAAPEARAGITFQVE